MPLTFGEIKRLVAPYAGRAGKCATSPEVDLFARQVMEYLLYSGDQAGTRKICILAHKGCISLPPEVEVPLKVKIDRQVGEIWTKWCSFHAAGKDIDRCLPAERVLVEDGALSPLAYQLPHGGSVVGVMATCSEDEDAYVLVQGKDPTGRVIYTTHDGEQVPGEKFRLVKGQLRYGEVKFGEITAVTKSRTNGYVLCYAVNVHTECKQFLADWSPSEEKPLYRVYRVTSRECGSIVHLTMLCRVRLKDNYHDNEITFFENSLAVTLAAQRLQSEVNNDVQTANYKRQATEDILEKEAGYKKLSGSPVDVYYPLSGGAIRNIVQ